MTVFKRYRAVFILLLATVFIAGCGVRTGVSWPDVSVIEDSEGQPLIQVAYNDYVERVDLSGNSLFLLDETGNIRRDSEGRSRKWEIRPPDGVEGNVGFYITPIQYDEDTLIVPDYNDRLLLFDATDQYVRLSDGRFSTIDVPGRIVAKPVIYDRGEGADRFLLVPFTEGDVMALNIDDDFIPMWTFDTARGVWDSPLIIDDVAYIAGMDHNLYAVNARTGTELWRVDLNGAIGGQPYYDGEALYVGSLARQFVRIDISGEYDNPEERITARYDTEGWVWGTAGVAEDGTFYVADMNGFVYALTINETGDAFTELWKNRASSGGIRATPIVTSAHVVLASRSGSIYWLDPASGSEIRRQNLDTELLADMVWIPASEENQRPAQIIVTTSDNGKLLVSFSADGSARNWTYER